MPKETPTDDLWTRYRAEPTKELRDELILRYAPLVSFVAGRVAVGLPSSVEQAELAANGMFGLIDAIEKFDPERGFKFETYAMSRIRGAILDELRSFDWVPRSVRAKARQLEQAYRRFEAREHRAPTDAELSEALGLDDEQLQTLLAQVSMTGIVALNEIVGGEDADDSSTLMDVLPADDNDPDDLLGNEVLRQQLAEQIGRLPEREKLVLTLYYYEGLTLADIGQVIGVTESRVCQIHTKAVVHLRTLVTAADRDTAIPRRVSTSA